MRYVIVFFLGLCAMCMWSCGKSDKEMACVALPNIEPCHHQARWQDGRCERGEVVPDGEKCLSRMISNFCASECICQDGNAKYKKRVCDNGNPCMVGMCEQERTPDGILRSGPETYNKCFFYPGNDGKTCGKDNTGVCLRGLCTKQDAIIPPLPAPLEPVFSFSQ